MNEFTFALMQYLKPMSVTLYVNSSRGFSNIHRSVHDARQFVFLMQYKNLSVHSLPTHCESPARLQQHHRRRAYRFAPK